MWWAKKKGWSASSAWALHQQGHCCTSYAWGTAFVPLHHILEKAEKSPSRSDLGKNFVLIPYLIRAWPRSWVSICSWGVRNYTQKLLCFATTLAPPGEDITTPGEPASVHNHEALLGPISSCNQSRMPPEKNKTGKQTHKPNPANTHWLCTGGEKSSLTLPGCWLEPKISQLIVVTVKPNDHNNLFWPQKSINYIR